MKLAELITPVSGVYAEDGYPHLSKEERGQIMGTITTAIEEDLDNHVNGLPYPTSVDQAYMTRQIVLVPANIQRIIIDVLDDRLPEEMVVEKTLLYFQVLQELGTIVLGLYETGWRRAMKRLGIDAEALAIHSERLKREN